MESNNTLTTHCLRVSKVFDWISKPLFIKLKKCILVDKQRFDDFICCDFSVPCKELEKTTLWTSYGINEIGGSICIKLKSGCGGLLSVFINGKKEANISEGSSFSGTFLCLDSIEVRCEGIKNKHDSCCFGEFKINSHYYCSGNCNISSPKDIKSTNCFLSDRYGNPLSISPDSCLLTCTELTSPKERTKVFTVNQLGELICLRKVDLLKQGFICVEFIDNNEKISSRYVFPFSEVETAVLCAPEDTKILCEIVDVDCKTHIVPSFHSNPYSQCIDIVIILSICQSIASVKDVKIEVEGNICDPREDLQDTIKI